MLDTTTAHARRGLVGKGHELPAPGDVVTGSHLGAEFIGRVHYVSRTRKRSWYVINLDGALFAADGRRLDGGGHDGRGHVLHLTNPALTLIQRCGLPARRADGLGWVVDTFKAVRS